MAPRLKTDIRVGALLRRAQAAGAFACILRRGDADAGALWVISRGGSLLRAEAISHGGEDLTRYSEQMGANFSREWVADGPFTQADLDLRVNKAVDRDPDLWVVEIENGPDMARLLDGPLAVEGSKQAASKQAVLDNAKALFRD